MFSIRAVIPWALESWANYTIDTYVDENMSDPQSLANTEHAIVTMNHPGDLDWMVGWVVINRVGMLGVSAAVVTMGDPLIIGFYHEGGVCTGLYYAGEVPVGAVTL